MNVQEQINNCRENLSEQNITFTLYEKGNYYLCVEFGLFQNFYSVCYFVAENERRLDESFTHLKDALEYWNGLNIVTLKFEKLTKGSILATMEYTGCDGYVCLNNIGEWAYFDNDEILTCSSVLDDWIDQNKTDEETTYELAIEQIAKLEKGDFEGFILKDEELNIEVEHEGQRYHFHETIKTAYYHFLS